MTAKSNRTCILVLGMHRSGTSALSRVLGLLGCTLPKNNVQADQNNQTGYWEPLLVNSFNNEVLESAGSSWDDWAPCSPGWFEPPNIDEFKERATKVLIEEFGDANLMVLKEPRICRLLPLWLPVLEEAGIQPRAIIPIRNPKEVANSMAKRDGSDVHYNQLVWLRHVLEAEKGSRGIPRAVVTYNDLLENHALVASTAEQKLGIKWPRRSARASDEIESYISEQHRSQKLTDRAVFDDPSTSDWVRKTYEIMTRWARLSESKKDYATLDSILEELDGASLRFGRLVYRGKAANDKLNVAQADLLAKEALIASLEQRVSQQDQQKAAIEHEALKAENLQAELIAVRKDLADLHVINSAAHIELEKRIQSGTQVVSELAAVKESSQAAVTALDEQVLQLQNQLVSQKSSLTEEVALLQAQLVDLQEGAVGGQAASANEIKSLQEQLVAAQEAMANLQSASTNEIKSLQEQLVVAQESLVGAQTAAAHEMKLLHDKYVEAQNQISATAQTAAHATNEHANVVSDLATRLASVQGELEAAKTELDSTRVSLETAQNDHARELRLAASQSEAATYELKQARSTHSEALSALEKMNAGLVKGFKDTFGLAEQDNRELSAKLGEVEAELQALEQARRNQLFEMNQLRSSLAQKSAEADDYHFEIKRTKTEKADASAAIVELEARIRLLQVRGSKLATQIQDIVKFMDAQGSIPLVPRRFKRAASSKILNAAGLVDKDWYLRNNPDVSALGLDATVHYVTHGASEGRAPNEDHKALQDEA